MKIPLVLIVGRPNVGKSTLFNRLTKSKDAIVDDSSGVTRDRIYGDCEWNGKIFKVMDTGGYVPKSEDLFEIAIKEQIQFAVEEADLILFMVDGRIGVTHVDQEIADIIRRSNKKVILLVNKLDNTQMALNVADFYSLAFKHVFDVAAISGRNLGDMLDIVIDSLNFPESENEDDSTIKFAMVGRPNVGKSSLTNSLLGFDRSIVTNIPGTTRDSIDSVLKYYGEEFILVDTAGLRRKTKVKESIEFYSNVRTFKAIGDCDVAIVLLDAELGLEKQDQRILDEAVRRRKGIIIAVNKWDLIEKETNTARDFELKIKDKLGNLDYVPIIFVSALTKQRIYKLIELGKSVAKERKKLIPTNELNDKLLVEFERSTPPATATGREVKIKFITQVGKFYPIFLLFANNADTIPDHYRRFVEKQIRKHYGFVGVPMTVSFREK